MNPLLLLFFISSLLSLPLSAQDNAAKMRDFNHRLTALEEQSKKQKVYDSSARPQVADAYNVYLTGDFLWWKAQENGLDYVILTDDPTQTDTPETQTIKHPQFAYDMGFRVGLGYNIPHDSWDLFVEWTRFHTLVSSHTFTKTSWYGLFTPWSSFEDVSETAFAHGQSHWKLDVDIIDGEVGRAYYVGKWLSLRPSLGLRTVWIKQHDSMRNDTFLGDIIWKDTIHLVNDYSGIGPKASLETTWDLIWGFNLYGSGTLSLLYGEFEIRRHEDVDYYSGSLLPSQKRNSHDDFHLVRAMADLQIGLGWDITFMHDKFHFGIRACWEQMIFFGQNQLNRLGNPNFQGSTISNLGDLSFQGGTLTARIDF